MNDPNDDHLRRALLAGAGAFTPAGPPGVTRATIIERIRRRRRRMVTGGAAAALALGVAVVAVLLAAPGPPDSRQVAATGGAAASGPTSSVGSSTVATSTSASTPPCQDPRSCGASVGTGTASSIGAVVAPPPSSTPVRPRPTTTTTPATSTTTHLTTTTTTSTSTSTTPAPHGSGQVAGTALFGPVCPVEHIPPDPACAPRPGAVRVTLVRANGSVAASGDAGADGRFNITVAPGTYTVQAATAQPTPGRGCSASPATVMVKPGQTSTVAVSCDTGIR